MPRSPADAPTTATVAARGARLPLAAGLLLLALGCQGPDPTDTGASPATTSRAAAVETLFPGSGGGNGPVQKVDFPTTSVGSSGPPLQNLVFRGAAPDEASPTSVTVRRVILSNSSFRVTDDNCTGATIGARASCTVAISFVPKSAGLKTADLRVETTGADIVGLLSGTATGEQDTPRPTESPTPSKHTTAPATPTVTRSSASTGYSP
ncbi:hypothetical protein [Kitasatospora herbaricolor]|uniref:Abnormal spindle-like microcephaly-associated protein ASH domain-containing protein n=1 Tax=Kitasatospora herbaricolor TaxID=68217 RepID=A0ABZ1WD00_9ACTN|nr:hypothetical protein [Kitasatospora herbaricolor]